MGATGGTEVEVFFCSAPQTDERVQIALDCWEYWQKQNCELHFLSPETLHCTPREFNRLRRVVAEEKAKNDFYILTDDDCIPIVPFNECVKRATEIMVKRRDFTILSFWPVEASIERWRPEGYEVYEDLDVMEHVSVGGLRFVRKNGQLDLPTSYDRGYDLVQADHIRRIGGRVGYFQHLRMSHKGEGHTDLWAAEFECV
jgi:hypothetical protein